MSNNMPCTTSLQLHTSNFLYSESKIQQKMQCNFGSNDDCSVIITLHKKMKFFIKDIFSKYSQIRRKLQIWSHLLKES